MQITELVSILSLGFLLGIKHAIEPDHVIAVSTIASQSQKIWKSSLTGVCWGIGHTFTLCLAGLSIILMKGEIPEVWAKSLEYLVGIMLVYFGISTLIPLNRRRIHREHTHDHRDKGTVYVKSLFMGLVHGLAGSAAMVLLTLSTIQNIWGGILYMFVFGTGTIIGMLCFTTLLGIPFVISSNKIHLNKAFSKITGVISTVFGIYYMYHLGVSEGLFHLWMQNI